MHVEPMTYHLPGGELLLRPAEIGDAPLLVDYLKTVSGETPYLRCEADEITSTVPEEEAYIARFHAEGKKPASSRLL